MCFLCSLVQIIYPIKYLYHHVRFFFISGPNPLSSRELSSQERKWFMLLFCCWFFLTNLPMSVLLLLRKTPKMQLCARMRLDPFSGMLVPQPVTECLEIKLMCPGAQGLKVFGERYYSSGCFSCVFWFAHMLSLEPHEVPALFYESLKYNCSSNGNS